VLIERIEIFFSGWWFIDWGLSEFFSTEMMNSVVIGGIFLKFNFGLNQEPSLGVKIIFEFSKLSSSSLHAFNVLSFDPKYSTPPTPHHVNIYGVSSQPSTASKGLEPSTRENCFSSTSPFKYFMSFAVFAVVKFYAKALAVLVTSWLRRTFFRFLNGSLCIETTLGSETMIFGGYFKYDF
jgi:hypothetical protein